MSEHRIIESVNRGELEDGRDSVAEGWQECWNTFESGAQTVSDHLVELAKINPNSRVLDEF